MGDLERFLSFFDDAAVNERRKKYIFGGTAGKISLFCAFHHSSLFMSWKVLDFELRFSFSALSYMFGRVTHARRRC